MLKNTPKTHFILASNSPRRKELMTHLNIPFEVKILENADESYPDDLAIHKVPEFLAKKKASLLPADLFSENTVVITADTIVCIHDEILGKPKDYHEGYAMLKQLSGTVHEVITGVAITSKNKQIVFHSTTKVYFSTLSHEQIDYYLRTFKPYDKAGAYGIQEWIGMTAIEKVEGSYFNVVGLPVQQLYKELLNF